MGKRICSSSLKERAGIENQCDVTIAKNRPAGHSWQALHEGSEILDHDFLLADHFVDQQRRDFAGVLHDDDDAVPWILCLVRDAEAAVQAMNWHKVSTKIQNFSLPVHGGNHFARGPQRPLNGRARKNEAIVPHPNDKSVDDRHRQRKLDLERGAMTDLRGDFDFDAEFFDIALHDIHADAATGN